MEKLGIVCNAAKPAAVDAARTLVRELDARGLPVVLTPEAAAALGVADRSRPFPGGWGGVDLAIVLGGDGTLLRAAKAASPLGLPVLGVNTGHLGFLTEMEAGELLPSLDGILSGEWQVEERMMLRARVMRRGQEAMEGEALNDAVIARGTLARMVHFTARVGTIPVADYAADGVIVATPTGSTAYSLSAGGPILHPGLSVLLVTPICPHTFNARSLVVPGGEAVTVELHDPGEVLLQLDGQTVGPLLPGDEVVVERAPQVARLVRRSPFRFYDVLRRKLAEPQRIIGTSFGH